MSVQKKALVNQKKSNKTKAGKAKVNSKTVKAGSKEVELRKAGAAARSNTCSRRKMTRHRTGQTAINSFRPAYAADRK